ncbi:MAG: hypothetical protein GEU93_18705 [Propionibacteriales bacterium]|nr:hypothetical protein [Propionibacteriales bacterium]
MSGVSGPPVRVAVPELRRMAPDVVRILGLPLGQADETAEMVAWTEAAVGGALRFIHENRARLLWSPRPRVTLVTRRSHESTLDAGGGSLLEFGVRIADFACAEASSFGHARVVVRKTYGSVFVPYLAWRARRLGCGLAVRQPGTGGAGARADASPEGLFDLELLAECATGESDPPDADPSLRSRHDASVREGVAVAPEDFRSFVQLFEMLRAPTSERSRTHAG